MSPAITTPALSMIQTRNLPASPAVARRQQMVTWTPEAHALLREEWGKGTSARDIAAMLTAQGFPATKNSVLGRAFREKIGTHEKAWKRPPEKPPLPDLTKPTGFRWIDGDAAGWKSRWCDAPTSRPGGSWCETHRAIVFRPKTLAEVQASAGVHKNTRAA